MNNSELHHSDMSAGTDERLADLEARLAFQEDALQVLSRQMAALQQVTEQQQRMLQTLYRQLCEMRDGMAGDEPVSAEEKPPHY